MLPSPSPVLAYDRPLAPGTVRISPVGDGVCVRIAPDAPKRVVLTVLLPATLPAAAIALAGYGLFISGMWTVGLPILILLGAIGGYYLYRTLLRSDEPIVFTADPKLLRIQNPLDEPPDQTIAVFTIAAVQLRRVALHTTTYEIEVCTKDIPGRPTSIVAILTSGSYETLDRIGRTLVRGMNLPEPRSVDAVGWASVASQS